MGAGAWEDGLSIHDEQSAQVRWPKGCYNVALLACMAYGTGLLFFADSPPNLPQEITHDVGGAVSIK